MYLLFFLYNFFFFEATTRTYLRVIYVTLKGLEAATSANEECRLSRLAVRHHFTSKSYRPNLHRVICDYMYCSIKSLHLMTFNSPVRPKT
jgi:hypothetical protein